MKEASKHKNYDYIIAGAGCAGLSLLYRIMRSEELNNSRILVIDKVEKSKNDKTWCFWESEAGIFEDIVHHHWDTLEFINEKVKISNPLKQYTYKMIKGIDFYTYVLKDATKYPNITFVKEDITRINSHSGKVSVVTETSTFTAKYVFNSTHLFKPKLSEKDTILQHFTGWVIKTEKEIFTPNVGTLMDFRVPQIAGDTFVYLLPQRKNRALIEYTVFSKQTLSDEAYSEGLKTYIKKHLNIDKYKILHKEHGVLPMTTKKYNKEPLQNVINIGTIGGAFKPSTGYAFQFIQKQTKAIVSKLEKGKYPYQKDSLKERKFNWYDRVLLNMLIHNRITGKEVFSRMFQRLDVELILQFLNNETTLVQELKIFRALPFVPFLVTGMKSLQHK